MHALSVQREDINSIRSDCEIRCRALESEIRRLRWDLERTIEAQKRDVTSLESTVNFGFGMVVLWAAALFFLLVAIAAK